MGRPKQREEEQGEESRGKRGGGGGRGGGRGGEGTTFMIFSRPASAALIGIISFILIKISLSSARERL